MKNRSPPPSSAFREPSRPATPSARRATVRSPARLCLSPRSIRRPRSSFAARTPGRPTSPPPRPVAAQHPPYLHHPPRGTFMPLRTLNSPGVSYRMLNLLLFLILMVICWPLALAALLLYPLIWLILLPFRLVGLVVGGAFELIGALFMLPVRMLRAI